MLEMMNLSQRRGGDDGRAGFGHDEPPYPREALVTTFEQKHRAWLRQARRPYRGRRLDNIMVRLARSAS